MNRKWKQFIAIVALSCVLVSNQVLATPSKDIDKKMEDVKNEMEKNKEELSEINEEIGELEDEQAGLLEEIEAISNAVVELMAGIEVLEGDIAAKEEEIEVAKADLEKAIAHENEQYELTKERLQAMYETGNVSYIQILIESQSLQDFLTRMEYVEQVYKYDTQMLEEYQYAKEAVIELKNTLEIEEAELIGAKEECELEKQELEGVLAELKAVSKEYDSKIAAAEKQAKDYAKKIKKQNEEIRKLEKQKEAERKKAERENNGGGGDNSGGGKKHQGSEYELDPSVITGSYGSEEGKQVALYAIQFLGNPYKAGGTSLTDGTDCSGFTMSVYKNFGISIPRTSYSQRSCGVGVDYADAQPGDIICYSGHVGLYVGQGLIVHASSAKTGIKISKATYRTILAVRRVV